MKPECEYIKDVGDFLATRATSEDVGDMVQIIAKTPIGIEWRSSLQGDWFMQPPTAKNLFNGWDGKSDIYWFWDATFSSGRKARACVYVPCHLVQEIKEWVESLTNC